MPTYRVTNVIQSGNIDGNEPVEVDWYKGDDLAQAIAAMAQSACHGRDGNDTSLPESMRFKVLSVHLDISH